MLMSPEAQAFVVFSLGMLVLMGIGMNMALALVLTGAGMAWVLDFWDTQLLAQNLVAGVDSFPLLAVPFFILAGELMNSRRHQPPHHRHGAGLGGPHPRRAGLCGHWRGGADGQHERLGPGRHRGAGHHPAAHDAPAGLPDEHLGRAAGQRRHHRAHHPAVDALRDLRRHHQHLDLGAVRLGHRARG
jgi:hypothetical protein